MAPGTNTLRLAHSPDSDDLVMWWPLTGMRRPDGSAVEGELGTPRVDTEGLGFELVAEDVEALNRLVRSGGGDFDATAISAATYPAVRDTWRITACGGSFGEGYGPKIVVARGSDLRSPADLAGKTIAIPGAGTTAFLAMSLLLREAGAAGWRHEAMLFSDIPAAVAEGGADAGLLIHEAQLTFEAMGLRKLVDLGVWWQGRGGGLPLPLGLNVVRRDLDRRLGTGGVERVARVLARSVRYCVDHGEESRRFLKLHSEGRPEWDDPALVDRYLAMYVSGLTLDMGGRGRAALASMLGEGHAAGLCEDPGEIDVV